MATPEFPKDPSLDREPERARSSFGRSRFSDQRPDIVAAGQERLTRIERAQIRFIRNSFEPGAFDELIRWCQHHLGSSWIHHCTKHIRHVYGLERLPPLTRDRSFICVANHRSFFDLYVVTAELVRRGMPNRIAFPVRSQFFYDNPLGLFVNGVMSFFAMYPPIFRERAKVPLNVHSLGELVWLLRQGGVFAGLHPEGTRKLDDDPYTFLPAQTGVGRVIHDAQVTVLPVFINGLSNDLPKQVLGNFNGKGKPIVVVFGKPVDFGGLLAQRSSPRLYRAIAERTIAAISELGAEEKLIRAELDAHE